MPGPYTVDASVILNAFNPQEIGHADSNRFLSVLQSMAVPMIVPTLLLPEVSAAISRGRQDAELARSFTQTLSRLPHMVLVPLDYALANQAADIAAQNGLRGSDAVYAAVAVKFGTSLVTLDREQLDRLADVVITRTPKVALVQLAN